VNEFYDWSSEVADERILSKNWRSKNERVVNRLDHRQQIDSRCQAAIRQNCQYRQSGNDGHRPPLLMIGAYDELFQCADVAMTINYKWEKKWKHRSGG